METLKRTMSHGLMFLVAASFCHSIATAQDAPFDELSDVEPLQTYPFEGWSRHHEMPLNLLDLFQNKLGLLLPQNVAPSKTLALVDSSELPSLVPDGKLEGFKKALERQITRCQKLNPKETWQFGNRVVNRTEWCVETNTKFLKLANQSVDFKDLWDQAKVEFEWYQSTGNDQKGTVRFTGYYIPRLYGYRQRTNHFGYPLYKLPPEMEREPRGKRYKWGIRDSNGVIQPSYTRKQIDWEGVLDNRGLEIAYLNDPVEAYFLHVQGSGALMLTEKDGSTHRVMVNYAGQNGYAYKSIGQKLVKEGLPREYWTLQGMRRYFKERPYEIDRVFHWNPSYIFFQESKAGPFGSGATTLVGGHSIATDNNVFPLGAVGIFKVKRPLDDGVNKDPQKAKWINFSRLFVNQDTGGAIVGPGRVDVFWGEGDYAEMAAGGLHHDGELFFALIPEKKIP